MKDVDSARARIHFVRARSMLNGMHLLADDLQVYCGAVCLLAVHAAISLTDAILVSYTAERSRDQDHQRATRPLQSLCRKKRIDDDGVKHLSWLLSRKTDFSYGDENIARSEVQSAVQTAERYQAWVYRAFPQIADHETPSD